jgi:hypothetical protein
MITQLPDKGRHEVSLGAISETAGHVVMGDQTNIREAPEITPV